MDSSIRLILGLGNPGSSYSKTRHNVGREFVARLASERTLILRDDKFGFSIRIKAPDCLLAQLKSHMNESGPTLRRFLESHRLSLQETLVVTDDFMIPYGTLRLRKKGSSGGHNGLKSIIETFQTEEFHRLRMGIGPVPPGEDPADWVLSKFSAVEWGNLPKIFEAAAAAVRHIQTEGFDQAMTAFNRNVLS